MSIIHSIEAPSVLSFETIKQRSHNLDIKHLYSCRLKVWLPLHARFSANILKFVIFRSLGTSRSILNSFGNVGHGIGQVFPNGFPCMVIL